MLHLLHLQVGGVDEGGVPAGEESDGGRHLADVSDPVGDVELSPDRLPPLSPSSSGSLGENVLVEGGNVAFQFPQQMSDFC